MFVIASSLEARRLLYQNKNHVIATTGDKSLVHVLFSKQLCCDMYALKSIGINEQLC